MNKKLELECEKCGSVIYVDYKDKLNHEDRIVEYYCENCREVTKMQYEDMFKRNELECFRRLIIENIKSLEEDLKKCNYDADATDHYNKDFSICDYELNWNEELLKKIEWLLK